MAQLLGPPMITALDTNGVKVSGAKLYGYLTGTTSAVNLYQDSGLTTPHAVPVLADSAGRFPAIYYDDSQRLRVKIYDASDVLIRDTDPVNPVATALRGYIAGLTMSTAGSSTSLSVAAGQASDSTSSRLMNLATTITKTTGAWVAGSNQGGLDAGTIAASTWYHWFLLTNPSTGATEIAFSTGQTAPTIGGRIPATYTLYRRIGSAKTDGSGTPKWVKFTQKGDEFLWDVAPADVSGGAVGLGVGLIGLSVPTGFQVRALITATVVNAGSAVGLYLSSPDQGTAGAAAGNFTQTSTVAAIPGGGFCIVRTNISGNIQGTASTAASTFSLSTQGWIDSRGRDD